MKTKFENAKQWVKDHKVAIIGTAVVVTGTAVYLASRGGNDGDVFVGDDAIAEGSYVV